MASHPTPSAATGGSLSDAVEDYVGFTPVELDDELRRLELVRRQVEARMAAVVAIGGARGVGARDGHRGPKQWAAATLNCSSGQAFRWVRRAKVLDSMPEVASAWFEGRVGGDQVDTVGKARANPRCGGRLRDLDGMLAEHAEQLDHEAFDVVVKRWETLADSDGAFDEHRDATRRRRATVATGATGVHLTMSGGDAVTAAEIEAIVDEACEVEYQADVAARDASGDDTVPLERTGQQRRFDAIVNILRGWKATTAPGEAAATVVDIVIDARTLGNQLTAHGVTNPNPFGLVEHPDVDSLLAARCETAAGVVIDPHLAMQHALAGHVRRVVVDANGVVINFGRKRRLFTGSARTAAMLLVRCCEHPGCDVPVKWCQVDHDVEFHAGGRTDQANARVLCGYHNRAKHDLRTAIRRTAQGRGYTVRADGTIILATGQRPPPPPSPDTATGTDPT